MYAGRCYELVNLAANNVGKKGNKMTVAHIIVRTKPFSVWSNIDLLIINDKPLDDFN